MDLQKLNLVELNAQELKETEGGWIIPFIVGALVSDALMNPRGSWEAIKKGWNDQK
ncbi:hypothetical protein [Elizabethkingia ursingii]|uniref:hypothetical protein n=1 Tax=Elizabethkingia ursingii TaxID=1756150 RepID=UPI002011765A|nr:hypothetical protein [Elizabethkingia ursingii]MCL1671777.1 hypothetical protein [Elizabethkingia ursingii]